MIYEYTDLHRVDLLRISEFTLYRWWYVTCGGE